MFLGNFLPAYSLDLKQGRSVPIRIPPSPSLVFLYSDVAHKKISVLWHRIQIKVARAAGSTSSPMARNGKHFPDQPMCPTGL